MCSGISSRMRRRCVSEVHWTVQRLIILFLFEVHALDWRLLEYQFESDHHAHIYRNALSPKSHYLVEINVQYGMCYNALKVLWSRMNGGVGSPQWGSEANPRWATLFPFAALLSQLEQLTGHIK